jgi:hypothetical protein
MRLVKFAQAAIGFAASGGVAVVLSGSAFAADGSAVTTSQPSAVAAPVTGKPTAQPPVANATQDGDKSSPSSSANSQTSAVVTTPGSDGPTEQGTTKGDKAGVMPAKTEPVVPVANELVTDHGRALVNMPAVAAAPKTIEERMSPVSHTEAAVVPTAVVITTPVVDEAQVLSRPVTYHTTVLTIKPMITSRVALAIDLAAAVPSASLPAKEPTPTQSSGLLGNLTAQLAGTVLPQALLSDGSILDHLMLALNVMMLSILLINVFTFTYGLWLRRGGFATAARSDAPSFNFLVATPLLSGYAALPLRSHGPLFSGGRNEILKTMRCVVSNDFRKEERS